MMYTARAITILVFLGATASAARAQTSGWRLRLDDGSVIDDAALLRVANDTLTFVLDSWSSRSMASNYDTVRLDAGRIDHVSRSQGASFGSGGLIGAGVGLGLTGVWYAASTAGGRCELCPLALVYVGPAFIVGGFLVGGIIGAATEDDPEFDLRGKEPSMRAAALHWIIASGRFAD